MKRIYRDVMRNAARRVIAIYSIAVFIVMLCEPVAAQRARASRPAGPSKVRVGEFALDFELPRLTFKTDTTGKKVGVISEHDTIRLSAFRGKKPVCMIMSSYT